MKASRARPHSVREEYLDRSAEVLRDYIKVELGVSVRKFAETYKAMGFNVSASTLGYFLARQHTRSPYRKTLCELIRAPGLPHRVRNALLDVIEFDKRIVQGLLKGERVNKVLHKEMSSNQIEDRPEYSSIS